MRSGGDGKLSSVSLPVLQPVRRRRRRHPYARFRALAALVVVAAGAGAGLVALRGALGGPHPAAARPPAKPTPARAPATRRPAVAHSRRTPAVLLHGPTRVTAPLTRPLTAKAAIVVDAGTGQVLWASHAHLRLPIASTTKIMTALLVLERLPLQTIVHVDGSVPRVPLVREGLRKGEQVPAWKLLYGLLLYSGNDDALALAIATAGSRGAFISLMNRRATALGLHDSHFAGPSGVVDRGNYSSAWDLAALARVAMHDPRFRAVVRTKVKRLAWAKPTYSKVYVNKNRFLELYPGAIGIKTGWTTLAGPCVVAAAKRHGRTLIAVVLDSQHEYAEAARLLNLGFSVAARDRRTAAR